MFEKIALMKKSDLGPLSHLDLTERASIVAGAGGGESGGVGGGQRGARGQIGETLRRTQKRAP